MPISDMYNKRNRTPSSDIGRALYLYFLGLSTRGVAKAMFFYTRLKEVTSQSGIGFKNVILERYPQKEKGSQNAL